MKPPLCRKDNSEEKNTRKLPWGWEWKTGFENISICEEYIFFSNYGMSTLRFAHYDMANGISERKFALNLKQAILMSWIDAVRVRVITCFARKSAFISCKPQS